MVWQAMILEEALGAGQFGLAVLDETLTVSRRLGALSEWLPQEGRSACETPMLMHMDECLAGLRREGGGEVVLPSMRTAPEAPRVTISISWSHASQVFIVVTSPDHAGEQIDRLMASDRREKQLLQQQADAASARLRLADALYRDIVESYGGLVLRFGPDGKIVFANRRAAHFLGRSQDRLIGAALDGLFPAPETTRWRLEAAAEGAVSFEAPVRDAKGQVVWLAWDVSFLGPEAGGEFQAVARDVTDARRLRVEREKAQEEARAAAIANERLRIAHDLHDTLVRSIVTMIAQARVIAKTTIDPEAKAALSELDAQARQGLWEAREAIAQTRAPRREDKDLHAIVKEFEQQCGDVAVCLDSAGAGALPRETEQLFSTVLREALRNIELHAGASRVRVAISKDEAAATLLIEDNGAGFDPEAPKPDHFGVTGMRERAALSGATLAIDSAPGSGTRIRLIARID